MNLAKFSKAPFINTSGCLLLFLHDELKIDIDLTEVFKMENGKRKQSKPFLNE